MALISKLLKFVVFIVAPATIVTSNIGICIIIVATLFIHYFGNTIYIYIYIIRKLCVATILIERNCYCHMLYFLLFNLTHQYCGINARCLKQNIVVTFDSRIVSEVENNMYNTCTKQHV